MKNYLSLIKFSHTIFALPFAMIGFFLAVWQEGFSFSWQKLMLVLSCMVFARSAAMAFNRVIDEKFDSRNPRTANREIPAGVISKYKASLFTAACMLAFMGCTYFINWLCFMLSPVALLVILGYSYTKRFTHLSHFVLGLGLALAPVGAYLAVAGSFGLLPVLLGMAVLCWVSGFDIIYALQDVSFDKEHALHSVPVWIGKEKALLVSSAIHILCFACLILIGILGHFGSWYWTGCIIFTILLIYQHTIVKADDLARVNVAFFTTNGIASVIFAIFVLIDIY
ncbi:MAG: putative 4-hydroxybenzoate polyprenyltransferase [Chitinophagales bacterium]|nr:putative 4-hydroxybenzoate polyprenyltransferase [Chitinophagales bacterium]